MTVRAQTVFALATVSIGMVLAGCSGSEDGRGGDSAARSSTPTAGGWHALGEGTFGDVYSLASHADGTLYVGGSLREAGGQRVNAIARWDGSAWSAIDGVQSPLRMDIKSMAIHDDGEGPALFAAISDDGLRLAKLGEDGWELLGEPINGTVECFAVADLGGGPVLFAGGGITNIRGADVSNFGWWSSGGWQGPSIDDGTVNNAVFAMTPITRGDHTALVLGGWFSTVGWDEANFIAEWDGSTWSNLGGGVDETVHALTVFDDGSGEALYAGGEFTTAGGVSARGIARWNGSAWTPVGDGVDGIVHAMAVHNGVLFVGGRFTAADGTARNIAAWDGARWSALGEGTDGTVHAMVIHRDALIVGGEFTRAGGNEVGTVARWVP